MPGIFGLIRKKSTIREENDALISGMLARLAHNDEYMSNIHVEDWYALGQISIPFANEQRLVVNKDSGFAAAFSGFIYGWKNLEGDLSRPSGQSAAHLINVYCKYKTSLPEKIDGSFNAAVFDGMNREAIICNDRFGHRQMYYFEDDELFLFSTEMKAFLAYARFPRDLDMNGIANFFNYGYPLGDKTFFKRVRHLRGGHKIIFGGKGISFQKYWDYKYGEESSKSIPELVEEMDSMFREIIRKRIRGSEQIAIPLSGGLDSRFILSHTIEAGRQPHAFTHGKKNCLDHKIARQVAKRLNVRNYRFIEMQPYWLAEFAEKFVFLSEGMNNTGPAGLLGVSREYNLPPKSTAFLNGIFGGPTNFGSPYFKAQDIVKDISIEEKLANLRHSLWGDLVGEEHYELFLPEISEFFRKDYIPGIAEDFAHYEQVSPWFCNQKDVFFIKNRLGRHMNLVDCNRFIWHDHFPLADDNLVDFFIKIPVKLKLSRVLMIEYFKTKLPELAHIPYQSTGVDLYSKPSPWKRKLQGYVSRAKHYGERFSQGRFQFYNMKNYAHFSQWYRADKRVREYFESILLDDRTIRRGFFQRGGIERILERQRKGANSFFVIADLLSFELFNRLFVDK